jgi:hypothetical protein
MNWINLAQVRDLLLSYVNTDPQKEKNILNTRAIIGLIIRSLSVTTNDSLIIYLNFTEVKTSKDIPKKFHNI